MCVPSGRLAPSVGDAAVVCICVCVCVCICVCVNRHARHKAGTRFPKFACPKVHRCPFPSHFAGRRRDSLTIGLGW